MNWERYGWCFRAVAKFILLGGSAAICLLRWNKKGPDWRIYYYINSANLWAYLLWLLAACFLATIGGSSIFQWMTFSGIPAALAFFIPFLLAAVSLVVLIANFFLRAGERAYAVLFSALMLILWITSVAAPN